MILLIHILLQSGNLDPTAVGGLIAVAGASAALWKIAFQRKSESETYTENVRQRIFEELNKTISERNDHIDQLKTEVQELKEMLRRRELENDKLREDMNDLSAQIAYLVRQEKAKE